MKPLAIIGIILVVLGVFVVGYDYVPPRKQSHSVNVGPFGVTAEKRTKGSNPMPLIFGVLSVAGGLYLIFKKH